RWRARRCSISGQRRAGTWSRSQRQQVLVEWGLRFVILVGPEHVAEYIAGMVEHDVEDYVDAPGMSLVHYRPQLVIRSLWVASGSYRVRGKARLGVQEILDAVTVVCLRVILAILEARGQPDCSRAELVDVVELLTDAFECAALKLLKWPVEGDWRVALRR